MVLGYTEKKACCSFETQQSQTTLSTVAECGGMLKICWNYAIQIGCWFHREKVDCTYKVQKVDLLSNWKFQCIKSIVKLLINYDHLFLSIIQRELCIWCEFHTNFKLKIPQKIIRDLKTDHVNFKED